MKPAAQTEHFKGMIESANRLAARHRLPPPPGAVPGTFVIRGNDGRPQAHDFAWHAANEAERRKIGPEREDQDGVVHGRGSVRVPVLQGMPYCLYREIRCQARQAARNRPAQVRKPNYPKHLWANALVN